MKTLDRGRKFKGERYVNSDNVFAKNGDQTFSIKWKCKTSTKKEVISSEVGKCDMSSYMPSCEICILKSCCDKVITFAKN